MEDKNQTLVTEQAPVAEGNQQEPLEEDTSATEQCPTTEETPEADIKPTLPNILRKNAPFIAAAFTILIGFFTYMGTLGTQLLFTESSQGKSYRYYWLWLVAGVLFATWGLLSRTNFIRKCKALIESRKKTDITVTDKDVADATPTEPSEASDAEKESE